MKRIPGSFILVATLKGNVGNVIGRERENNMNEIERSLSQLKPDWVRLALEIQDKLKILTKEIYQTVPKEIQAHHRREALSGGTNWELTFWETDKHPAVGRMVCLESALGAINSLVFNANKENCLPTTMPKLARVRSATEMAEQEGRATNEWQKAAVVWRARRKEKEEELRVKS